MRLVLQGIHEWKDVGGARKLIGNWCAWAGSMREQTGDLLEPMARAARTIEGNKKTVSWNRIVEYINTKLYFVAGKRTLPRCSPSENNSESIFLLAKYNNSIGVNKNLAIYKSCEKRV
jgi:hypothetical protein